MATTYDIAAYQPATPYYVAGLATPTISGRAITGAEKLAQRFLLELVTEKGSMAFLPNRGSEFLPILYQGAMHELDVINAFSVAMSTITSNLRGEESPTGPLNERFSTAAIQSLSVANGTITLYILIYNLLGQASSISVPIQLKPIPGTYTSAPD